MKAVAVLLAGLLITVYAVIAAAMVSVWLIPAAMVAGGGLTGLAVARCWGQR